MRYSIRRAMTVLVLAALAGGIPALSHGGIMQAASAAAGTTKYCPPNNPAPGSTIYGNLVVNGVCGLLGVTVTGSITVMPRSQLYLLGSSVGGNISVQDAYLNSSSSLIRGNINMNQGSAMDLDNSSTVTGSVYGVGALVGICGSTVRGSINLFITEVTIGDPTDDSCPGNTIGAGLVLSYVIVGEVEGNTIGGSVNISHSYVEFASNTVAGSAACSSNTTFSDGDPATNMVKGSNTCG